MGFGIIAGLRTLVFSWSVTWELFGCVRDMQTSVHGTLQCSPHAGSRDRSTDANIQNTFEGSLVILLVLHVVLFTIKLFVTLEGVVQIKLLQRSACNKEASQICSRMILQTSLDPILRKFHGARLRHDFVSQYGREGNLADNLPVRESYDQTVLLGIVFVACLLDHLAPGEEVCLSLTTAPLLNLVPLEERFVLQNLDERHAEEERS
mmetsp:Transcript_22531/g.59492  ORF Transcript_22531/g.59492 Transcript_22531/m.59492 type:complete len:207 (-) Transcript_22531:25-645(-)